MEDKATLKDLDQFIEQLNECKQLTETQVKTLCDKVKWIFHAPKNIHKLKLFEKSLNPVYDAHTNTQYTHRQPLRSSSLADDIFFCFFWPFQYIFKNNIPATIQQYYIVLSGRWSRNEMWRRRKNAVACLVLNFRHWYIYIAHIYKYNYTHMHIEVEVVWTIFQVCTRSMKNVHGQNEENAVLLIFWLFFFF